MNSYQLDDKATDLEFLKGKAIVCSAVIDEKASVSEKLVPGDFILVILSNGKKYKGLITAVNFFSINHYAVGELTMVKAT